MQKGHHTRILVIWNGGDPYFNILSARRSPQLNVDFMDGEDPYLNVFSEKRSPHPNVGYLGGGDLTSMY